MILHKNEISYERPIPRISNFNIQNCFLGLTKRLTCEFFLVTLISIKDIDRTSLTEKSARKDLLFHAEFYGRFFKIGSNSWQLYLPPVLCDTSCLCQWLCFIKEFR